MLSIGKVALGGEEYYLATAASGRDHHEGLVEPQGQWLGSGAARLSLSEPAEPAAVRRLFGGFDPAGDGRLVEGTERRSIVAFDCTFSVPKSVSLVQAFSPDEAVRREMRLGHEAAVRASFAYLEDEAAAVRGGGVEGPRIVGGGELVAVGFVHRLSRAGDPHLHTHVLVANLVVDPDGAGVRPLDATGLFLHCRTAGALYETHLRHELSVRLGVEWQPLEGRCWSDLKGLDRAVILEFSQRSTQIAAAMATQGWRSPAAWREMAELTRPAKDRGRSYEAVIDDARGRLRRIGVSDRRLLEVCHRPQAGRGTAGRDDWQEEALHRLPARTVDGTFTLRDAIVARCATAREGSPVDSVRADARTLLAHAEVTARGVHTVWLRGGAAGAFPARRPELLFTTRSIVAAEERTVALAEAMRDARPGSVRAVGYEPGGRFHALDSLAVATAAWRREGRAVVAVAPGRWAAAGVESACGIDAVVVPGVAAAGRPVRPAPSMERGSVVVIAEAQTYGPEALSRLLARCQAAEATVVLLAPGGAIERRPVLAGIAEGAAGSLPGDRSGRLGNAALPGPHVVFGLVEVTLVPSLTEACAVAGAQLLSASGSATVPPAPGRPSLVVAGDEAVTAALRSVPGVAAGDVVHTRDLGARLSAFGPSVPFLIVVGGAAVLRQGATAAPGLQRSHVLVAPAVAIGSAEAVGRAAEAARPRYLTSELGVPVPALEHRRAWRTAAVAVEGYRERWLVADHRRAFGPAMPATSGANSQQAVERAAVERLVGVARQLGRERAGPKLDRPARGLGR